MMIDATLLTPCCALGSLAAPSTLRRHEQVHAGDERARHSRRLCTLPLTHQHRIDDLCCLLHERRLLAELSERPPTEVGAAAGALAALAEVPRHVHGFTTRSSVQAALDALLDGAFLNQTWAPRAAGGARLRADAPPAGEWARSARMANRSVVLLGDSTIRLLAWHVVLHDHRDRPVSPRRLAEAGWRGGALEYLPCGNASGSGCSYRHCLQCCDNRHCPAGPHADEHVDFAAAHASSGLRLAFSWKPQLGHEPYELAAFATRFCAAPPDLLVVSKGGHEASFESIKFTEPLAWKAEMARRLRATLRALECLPRSTAIVWRTSELSTRVQKAAYKEAPLMALTTAVVRRAFREGAVPDSAYLLDALALTDAASQSADAALHSFDGHHYPESVVQAEWELILFAWRMHQRRVAAT
jgi:hypothetical protein